MRSYLLGLSLSVVFAAGCVAGASSWAVPQASAARASAVTERQWAYFCFDAGSAEDAHTRANAAGQKGWELAASGPGSEGQTIWCFKQPK